MAKSKAKPAKAAKTTEKLPEKPAKAAPAEKKAVFGYADLSLTGKAIHKQITGEDVPGQPFLKDPKRLHRRIRDHENSGGSKEEVKYLRSLVK